MEICRLILIVKFSLLGLHAIVAQNVSQQKLDSLQHLLENMENAHIDELVTKGEYILVHSTSNLQKYEVLGVIINAYATKNEKQKSIRYLFRAKAIAESMDDPNMMVRVYGTIASLYASLHLNEKAKQYIHMSRVQIERLPDGKVKYNLNAFIYSETGTMYYNNRKYKKANDNFKKSLAAYSKLVQLDSTLKNTFYYRNAVYNVGKSFLYIKKPDSSLLYLNKALAIRGQQESSYLEFYIKTSLAEVFSYSGNHKRSIDTLKGILKDSSFDIAELKSEIYLDLAQNYKTLGDSTNYSFYNEKYIGLNPKIKGEDLHAINSVFVAEENRYKNSINNSKRNNQLLIWAIIAIILISAGGMLFVYWKNKKEQRIYKNLIVRLKNKKNTESETQLKPTHPPNYLGINSAVEEEILRKLDKFEKSAQFTNTKVTMASLAVKLKTNTTYLSDIINREKGKNYNAYINELRINYICKKIHANPEYLDYKISYLAEACGFSSHSAFATVFKNFTGISPSTFLKMERTKRVITNRQ